MPDTLQAGLLFLVNTIFDMYLFILIIRIILVWVGASYFDPITQFVVKLTDFIVKPLRRRIPNINRFETASVILLLLIEVVKFFIISSLSFGIPSIAGLLVLAFADSVKLLIQAFFYAILLQVILSWVQPYSPVSSFLDQFTSPIMRPIKRIVPPVAGFDISPIPALIILQLLSILLVTPLMTAGLAIAYAN